MDLKGAEIRNISDMCMSIGSKNRIPLQVNIPYYQRPYKWDRIKIENLISDFDKNKKENESTEYFIGSVVLVENHAKEKLYDIIDGQQRVTTVFLLNYIRFLIQRSYVEELIKIRALNLDGPLNSLVDYYTELLGRTHAEKISKMKDSIIEKMESIDDVEAEIRDQIYDEIEKVYQKEMFLPERDFSDMDKYLAMLEEFQKNYLAGDLCIHYSRVTINEYLLAALSKVSVVVSKEKNPELYIHNINDDTNPIILQFVNAIKIAFDKIIGFVEMNDKPIKNVKKILDYITDMIENIKFCVIITGNERDAYTLFEVLNDRAMEIDDLELIKNLYLKTYCCTSGDSEIMIDKNVGVLDSLWSDDIFISDMGDVRKKLISFLATIYITQDDRIYMNSNEKYRLSLENNYLKHFNNEKKYSFKKAKNDLNIYLMIKILLEEYSLPMRSGAPKNLSAIKSENDPHTSITFKTLHLINALNYDAVLPAIINTIIRQYINNYPTEEFQISKYKEYLKNIKEDKNHNFNDYEFKFIHNISFILWKAAILSNGYEKPRKIAKRIIDNISMNSWNPTEAVKIDLDDIEEMYSQFKKWISEWSYGNNDIKIKILFIKLFKTKYDKEQNALFFDKAVHTFVTDNLQLDHMEAQNPIESAIEKYFTPSDPHELREKYVHGIGNMMILDSEDNNNKKNKPLAEALSYYEKMCSGHWLSEEISDLLNEYHNEVIIDKEKFKVPNEIFFNIRKERIITYFEKIATLVNLDDDRIILK